MNQNTLTLIKHYYAAFNAGDMDTFLGLLTDDVVHDINQGARETGKDAFRAFMGRMNRNYKEQLVDMVIMATEDGTRAAAEFVVLGEYLVTDEGPARSQGAEIPTSRRRVLRHQGWQGGPHHQLLQPGGLDRAGQPGLRAMSGISIKHLSGPELEPWVADLARLRITVFRDFPYLYDGTAEYEEKYLQTYIRSPDSIIVLALDGDKVVGASTGLPMEDETEEFQRPFAENGYDPATDLLLRRVGVAEGLPWQRNLQGVLPGP